MTSDGPPRSFAAVLDELCEHPVDRQGRLTNSELAQIIRDVGGDITGGYISHLRKGQRDNPTLQTIEDLATALRVCPAVFVGGRRERAGDERPRQSFSGKLRHLFAQIYPVDRGPYTPEEAAKSISWNGRYGSISSSYIRELLNPPGDTLPNPRLKHILGLADHFGLADDHGPQAAAFFDDDLAATLFAELADFVALRDAGVVEFVTRMSEQAPEWSPKMRRQAVEAFVNAVDSGQTGWVFPLRKGRPR